jgi:hypothetical protein
MLSVHYTKTPEKETVKVTFEGNVILETDTLTVRNLWDVILASGISAKLIEEEVCE